MNSTVPLLLLSATAVFFSVLSSNVAQADTSDSTYVTARTGFTGVWGNSNSLDTHPSKHHRVACAPAISGKYDQKPDCKYGVGDWSTDYYAAAGTDVVFSAYATGGTLTAKVYSVSPTRCKDFPNARGETAGWDVIIALYVNGSWEGWISYGHIDSVLVTATNSISSGTKIGKTRKWTKTSCYNVQYATGVHTHIEMWDKVNYACYKNYSLSTSLSSTSMLGRVGKTTYTTVRSPC